MHAFPEESLRQNIRTLVSPVECDQKEQFIQALTDLVGNRLISQPDRLTIYSYDATGEQCLPDAALVVQNDEELRLILEQANRFGVAVIARGSGSNISGGTLPILGGLVISLAQMKAIRQIDPDYRQAIIEPGVVNAELQKALKLYGFFFPLDPASHAIATVGGNVAEGSGGPHCVKYGTTAHYVQSLRAFLTDGTPVLCPDEFTRIDWPGLLTGSEGTLAVITEISVRILPVPRDSGMLLAGFDSPVEAVSAVSGIVRARQIPSALELLDKATLDTVRPFMNAGYPDCGAVLLIEVDGSDTHVKRQIQQITRILEGFCANPILIAETPEDRDMLMAARRSAYGAAARLASRVRTQDITVPRPLLAEMMSHVLAIAREYSLSINTVAHAGDGNLHPLIPFHPGNLDEVSRMRQADHAILKKAAELGGSITGEHGIGIEKLHEMPLMYAEEELSAMYAVKKAFDPRGLLNPGKAVYPVLSEPPHLSRVQTPPLPPLIKPNSGEELKEVMGQALAQKVRLATDQNRYQGECRISLANLRTIIDFDPDNMTITVEAGIPFQDIQAFLHDNRLMFPPIPLLPQQTLGALVAEGLPHLTQFGYGPLKNWILGLEVLDGRNRILRFGRKIMKNVAGFEMPKLFIGSLAQYGIITKLILRVAPRMATPQLYVCETKPRNNGLCEDLLHQLSPLAPGAQGLWTFSDRIMIYLDAYDLSTQKTQIENRLHTLNCPYQVHEATPFIESTQSFISRLYHRAYDEDEGIILGRGRFNELGEAYYRQLDDSLWIIPCPAHPAESLKALQGTRLLNQSGWHLVGREDPHLASIAERIKNHFDPLQILTQVPVIP